MLILAFTITWLVILIGFFILHDKIRSQDCFSYYTGYFESKSWSTTRYDSLTKDIVQLRFIINNFDKYMIYKNKYNGGEQDDLTDTNIVRLITDDLHKQKLAER